MQRRIVVVVAVLALLAGCGGVVRVAYNNGDVALRYMAHDYFDLHGSQADVLKVQLERFHAWHRREELPRYAAAFHSVAERLQKGLSRDDVTWAIATVRTRYGVLAEHGVDEAIPVLATLTPHNIAALEKKQADGNAKFVREYMSVDEAQRQRARTKALAKRFEEWLGDLTEEQNRLVAAFVRGQPRLGEMRFENRKRRQKELVALLSQHRDAAALAASLRDYLIDWERDRSPELARMSREWEDGLVTLIVDMDRTLTPAQRTHAVNRFARYANDFSVLAREGRPPAGAQAALQEALLGS